MQKLISHGHTKDVVLNQYSMPEVKLFYEKIIAEEMYEQADFIEGVVAGIGGAFGDYNKIAAMLQKMRRIGE